MRALGTGEMSRASGLSRKALRLYEASGLLVPAEVDARTGYRSYARDQVARARTIALLRRIDLPLARIGELLEAPPAASRELLLDWWASQRDDFAARSQAVDRLAAEPRGATGLEPGIAVEADRLERVRFELRPDTAVASIARTVEQAELVPSFVADVLELRAHLEHEGATPTAGHWVIFHSPVGDRLAGRIETAVPFTGRAAPTRSIGLRVEPATRFAVVDVTAREVAYPSLLGFYDLVHAAASAEGGADADGAPREWYPGAWPDDPEAVAMQVATPVARIDPAPGADPMMAS
ncbi:MAG TPA: MerR family transcriptional regulator [Agromyces sp.]